MYQEKQDATQDKCDVLPGEKQDERIGDLLSCGTVTSNVLLEAAVGASSSSLSCDVEASLQEGYS